MKKVLFLCIGNSCRSQMAEGFARKYGSDVILSASAGLAPASVVQPLTKKVMEAKNINIDEQYPKTLEEVNVSSFDVIVNISGQKLPTRLSKEVKEWKVDDPMGKSEDDYVSARDLIENHVMRLILDLRRTTKPVRQAPAPPTAPPQRVGFLRSRPPRSAS